MDAAGTVHPLQKIVFSHKIRGSTSRISSRFLTSHGKPCEPRQHRACYIRCSFIFTWGPFSSCPSRPSSNATFHRSPEAGLVPSSRISPLPRLLRTANQSISASSSDLHQMRNHLHKRIPVLMSFASQTQRFIAPGGREIIEKTRGPIIVDQRAGPKFWRTCLTFLTDLRCQSFDSKQTKRSTIKTKICMTHPLLVISPSKHYRTESIELSSFDRADLLASQQSMLLFAIFSPIFCCTCIAHPTPLILTSSCPSRPLG